MNQLEIAKNTNQAQINALNARRTLFHLMLWSMFLMKKRIFAKMYCI